MIDSLKRFLDSKTTLIIPHADMFFGEYLAAQDELLDFFVGFTGSAGTLVIHKHNAILLVDGRYTLQAKKQTTIEVQTTSLLQWLKDNKVDKIAFDPWRHSVLEVEAWNCHDLHPLSDNWLENIWLDRPAAKQNPVTSHVMGEDNRIQKLFAKFAKATGFVFTRSEDLAWLLNLRGSDLEYTPVFQGYVLVLPDSHIIFAAPHPGIECLPFSELKEHLLQYKNLHVDKRDIPFALWHALIEPMIIENPILAWRAQKNIVEIQGAKNAHFKDGLALCNGFLEIEQKFKTLDECDVADILLHHRSQDSSFKTPSFPTICGSGPNGAIVHYRALKDTCRALSQDEVVLIDSGGQYLDGTTDITRVWCFSTPETEIKTHYTLVLKGHIALAMAKFPKGTNGSQLDILARQFLWQHGLDYAHGTGHGVGAYLNVHEGPQGISPYSRVPLQPGMIISNEPGYYLENQYGIRLENLVLVVEQADGFLGFETLTLVPFDLMIIDFSLLSDTEKAWLLAYQTKVFESFSALCGDKEWLAKRCLG